MTKFRMGYFAYPIDQAPMASMVAFYQFIEQAKRHLLDEGLIGIGFDPGDAFKIGRRVQVGLEVEQVNMAALGSSDLIVAFLPTGIPTIGVPAEIERALSVGKTVILFTDNGDSWSVAGFVARGAKVVEPDEDGLAAATEWLLSRPQEADPVTQEMPDPMPVRLLSPESQVPTRGYPDDAGLDLYVTGNYRIAPGEFYDVPCGVAVELPEWSWGLLTGRSSTLRSKQLLVHSGIIDCGYRGPLFAGVWNLGDTVVEVKNGERIAQLIVLPNLTKTIEPTEQTRLADHPRGMAGFGSTGS